MSFLGFVLWFFLLIICWPIALLLIILYPIFWLLTIPLRLIGITVDAIFKLIRALLFLPARVLRGI